MGASVLVSEVSVLGCCGAVFWAAALAGCGATFVPELAAVLGAVCVGCGDLVLLELPMGSCGGKAGECHVASASMSLAGVEGAGCCSGSVAMLRSRHSNMS